jgi:PilZ domain
VDREYLSRRAGRFIPSSSVTVALLEENLPIAYGVVRDLSEAGACIMTDTNLSPGRAYQFRMSFFGGKILEAVAQVAWRESDRDREGEGEGEREPTGIPHGIEFIDIQRSHLDNLRAILQSTSFGAKNAR